VYEAGEEPDARFTLANERTFLAWFRTALALAAGGAALHALSFPGSTWLHALLEVGLILLGAVICAFAFVRWARVERAMRLHQGLPSFGLELGITVAMVVVAALLIVLLV
jgi:putative membrane protein